MKLRSEPMKRLAFALLLLTWTASPSLAAGLKLSIHDGLVSLDAQDVTVRQILTEWERVGKTRMINVERITGGPVTLKFDNTPEKQALDIVLRTIPGYVALPRATPVADASLYERILIMATTTAVAPLPPQQPRPGYIGMRVPGMPGMYGGAQGGANITQLRPNPAAPLSPGLLPEPADSADQMDDPAIAAAAAAGLVPIPALNPGPAAVSAPLMPPGGAAQEPAPTAPGVGAPTNPWGVPVGTAQPSLAPPAPTVQAPPTSRARPPQADR
jgi:hypothetical protein